jgi:hypothetical protein
VVLRALEYAMSISKDVIAVHVKTGEREREAVLASWKELLVDIPLIVLDSPNRSVLRPLVGFIDEVRDLRSNDMITVVLPWLVPTRRWHNLLHNWISAALRDELRLRRGIVVTAVPYHLQEAKTENMRTIRNE